MGTQFEFHWGPDGFRLGFPGSVKWKAKGEAIRSETNTSTSTDLSLSSGSMPTNGPTIIGTQGTNSSTEE